MNTSHQRNFAACVVLVLIGNGYAVEQEMAPGDQPAELQTLELLFAQAPVSNDDPSVRQSSDESLTPFESPRQSADQESSSDQFQVSIGPSQEEIDSYVPSTSPAQSVASCVPCCFETRCVHPHLCQRGWHGVRPVRSLVATWIGCDDCGKVAGKVACGVVVGAKEAVHAVGCGVGEAACAAGHVAQKTANAVGRGVGHVLCGIGCIGSCLHGHGGDGCHGACGDSGCQGCEAVHGNGCGCGCGFDGWDAGCGNCGPGGCACGHGKCGVLGGVLQHFHYVGCCPIDRNVQLRPLFHAHCGYGNCGVCSGGCGGGCGTHGESIASTGDPGCGRRLFGLHFRSRAACPSDPCSDDFSRGL